jgi:hypothetical protein
LASCFKIVLANLELHLPNFSIVFFPKYTAEITVYNIKINCCKIQPRLENNRNSPHDVRSPGDVIEIGNIIANTGKNESTEKCKCHFVGAKGMWAGKKRKNWHKERIVISQLLSLS